jgi:hypothetical protein
MRFRIIAALATLASVAGAQGVARVRITPANPTVAAGDSLQLKAEALDASGRVVPGIQFAFLAAGTARFEGSVDSAGFVRSGSTGTIPVTVTALVPGGRPVIERIEVRMVPGPAARVAFDLKAPTLVVGQSYVLSASSYSSANDKRNDVITWRSSAPNVIRVGADGRLTALAAGTAAITATAGSVSAAIPVTVAASTVSAFDITPSTTSARTGDVIRFAFAAKGASGQNIAGVAPSWSFAPGHGAIEQDGGFVGYEAGQYTITATLGNRVAQATVSLEERDVRRPAIVVGRLPRTRFSTEEVWLHPNGKNAYLGSGRGGDVLYTLDISNPANPVITDSIIANTRRVNDVMTTPDGKFLVFTREGASDRKNGIVICSLEDPRIRSQFQNSPTA